VNTAEVGPLNVGESVQVRREGQMSGRKASWAGARACVNGRDGYFVRPAVACWGGRLRAFRGFLVPSEHLLGERFGVRRGEDVRAGRNAVLRRGARPPRCPASYRAPTQTGSVQLRRASGSGSNWPRSVAQTIASRAGQTTRPAARSSESVKGDSMYRDRSSPRTADRMTSRNPRSRTPSAPNSPARTNVCVCSG